jgi:hypothetical protein
MSNELAKTPKEAIDLLINSMCDPSDDTPTWREIAEKLYYETSTDVSGTNVWSTYHGRYKDKRVIDALIELGYLAPKKKRVRFTADATQERVTEIDALLLERGFSRKELIEVLPMYIRALMPSKYQYTTAGDRSLLPIYDDE